MKILVANVGSTSFKYKLYDTTDETVLAQGRIERIGEDASPIEHRGGTAETSTTQSVPDYPAAVRNVVDYLTDRDGGVLRDLADLDALRLAGPPVDE